MEKVWVRKDGKGFILTRRTSGGEARWEEGGKRERSALK